MTGPKVAGTLRVVWRAGGVSPLITTRFPEKSTNQGAYAPRSPNHAERGKVDRRSAAARVAEQRATFTRSQKTPLHVPGDALEVRRGAGQLDRPFARRSIPALLALQQVHEQLHRLAYIDADGLERNADFDDLVQSQADGRPASCGSPWCRKHARAAPPGPAVQMRSFAIGRLDERDPQRIEIEHGLPCRAVEVNANIEPFQIEAEIDVAQSAPAPHGHGAAFVLAFVVAGAQPFEKRLPAIQLHIQKRSRFRVKRPMPGPADRAAQVRRRRIAQDQVHVLQVLAKELVEQVVLGAE